MKQKIYTQFEGMSLEKELNRSAWFICNVLHESRILMIERLLPARRWRQEKEIRVSSEDIVFS